MTLKQISVFVENKTGKMQQLTDLLARNDINMRALSLAETSDFGIVRIIVDDLDAAAAVLENDGAVYTVTQVLGVAIPDAPGGMNRVLQVMAQGGINVEYMYAFMGGKQDKHAYMICHVQSPETAAAVLSESSIACIGQDDLASL